MNLNASVRIEFRGGACARTRLGDWKERYRERAYLEERKEGYRELKPAEALLVAELTTAEAEVGSTSALDTHEGALQRRQSNVSST